MNQMELEPKTKAVLDRIRHTDKVLSIFEMPADLAETAVQGIRTGVFGFPGLPCRRESAAESSPRSPEVLDKG